jgi:hypothetical protein
MDRSTASARLRAVGGVWLVLSSVHLIWSISQDNDTTLALAFFTCGLLVTGCALIWIRRDQNRTQ